jgi:hypothetical protein
MINAGHLYFSKCQFFGKKCDFNSEMLVLEDFFGAFKNIAKVDYNTRRIFGVLVVILNLNKLC